MVLQSFQQCCFCFYERYYYRHVPYTGITVYSMSFLLNLMLTSQLKKCMRRISERGFISYSVKYRVTKYKVWFSIHIRVVWLVVDYTAIQNSNLFTKGWGNGDFFFPACLFPKPCLLPFHKHSKNTSENPLIKISLF